MHMYLGENKSTYSRRYICICMYIHDERNVYRIEKMTSLLS